MCAKSQVSNTVDYARAIAILLVIATHTGQQIKPTETYTPNDPLNSLLAIFEMGAAGVPLFFVISGFLMTFLHSKEFSQKIYWKKRIARIYPLWLFWTVIAVVSAYFPITTLGNKPIVIYGHGVVLNTGQAWVLLFLQLVFLGWLAPTIWNSFIVGGWSIQAEMANYSLYSIFRRIKIEWLLFSISLLTILYILIFENLISPNYKLIAAAAVTSPFWFFSGMALADLMHRRDKGLKSNSSLIYTLVIASAVTLTCEGPFVSQKTSMLVVCCAIALSWLLARRTDSKVLKQIGKYSYGIYFAHFLFILPINRTLNYTLENLNWFEKDAISLFVLILGYLFVLAGSMGVSYLTYKYIEFPIIKISRRNK